jgi:starch synthase
MKLKPDAAKILFVSPEITPYMPDTDISIIGRKLPQAIQERGREIRTFMPKYGIINERRNQLHEVIRLSGMNLIIDDTDHPLIIKVASIQSARMQVYFIDNEDYFSRRPIYKDNNGKEFEDNDERCIFFARGVLETVKKLRWEPDIVHCQGWISSLIPLYIKKAYNDDPFFKNSKIVFSFYDNVFEKPFRESFRRNLIIDGVEESDLTSIQKQADYVSLGKLAMDFSDGVIQGSPVIDQALTDYAAEKQLPYLPYHPLETYANAYNELYNQILGK